MFVLIPHVSVLCVLRLGQARSAANGVRQQD
jgi:hypothetical protein